MAVTVYVAPADPPAKTKLIFVLRFIREAPVHVNSPSDNSFDISPAATEIYTVGVASSLATEMLVTAPPQLPVGILITSFSKITACTLPMKRPRLPAD